MLTNLENDESKCIYVSSRGILKSCDIFEECPKSSFRYLENRDWSTVKSGQIIYICGFAIPAFLKEALPKIRVPFILVSGDCDATMPFQVLPEEYIHTFLADNRLIAWFCQNLSMKHPKLNYLPIGLDYHTLALPFHHTWGPRLNPIQQENELKTIQNLALPLFERKIKIYGNFHFNLANRQYSQERVNALKEIPSNLIDYQSTEIPRDKTWQAASQYAFVASPAGGGLDCHRTWEALALGCIPIIKSSQIDELFEGLPVLIVKSWTEINIELLKNTVKKFGDAENWVWPPEPLKLSFWIHKMRQFSTSYK